MKVRRFLTVLFCTVAVLLGAIACMRDLIEPLPLDGTVLSLLPKVFQGEESHLSGSTKAPNVTTGQEVEGEDALRENFFRTLDVFVKRHEDAETDSWFRTYHLVAGEESWIVDDSRYLGGQNHDQPTSLLDEAKQLLARNWSDHNYVPGVEYDVFVTANNLHTVAGSSDLPGNLAALRALSTTKTNIMQYSVDEDIPSSDARSATNYLYKYEYPDDVERQKEFMMDGHIDRWTINPNKSEQVFEVELERAAAKIIVNVSFNNTIKSIPLISEDGTTFRDLDGDGKADAGTIVEYLDYVNREPGVPRWKYVNFAVTGADIAGGSYMPAESALVTYGRNYTIVKDDETVPNIDDTFSLVTYTYPVDWTSGNATGNTKIPFVLISFAYTKSGTDEYKLFYYRIPVCDERVVSSIERNKIYVVNAEIASLGSTNENLDMQDEQLRIEYHVLPWVANEASQEVTQVKVSDTKYLDVLPKTYVLKGNGIQSVDLDWFASVSVDDGQFVDIPTSSVKVTYRNYLGEIKTITGNVTKSPASPDGRSNIVVTSTAPTSDAAGETLTLTVKPNGVITVESQALESRAVKEIEFDVGLTGTNLTPVHIVMRHFPMDNIQSINGSWSSKWDGNSGTRIVREYSFNPGADGWDSYDGYEDNVTCSLAEYNGAQVQQSQGTDYSGTPSDNNGQEDLASGGNNSTMQTAFRNAVPQASRQAANSAANAYKDPNSDYWYWGTSPSSNGSYNNYDWYTSGWGTTYYRYGTYYRCKYTKTVYKARRYYRDVEKNIPSTGNWVDWENQQGGTNYDGTGFYAKYYVDGFAHRIETNGTSYTSQNFDNLTNRQMYVVQTTSTSDQYAIGYAKLDDNYQSQDNVVSPAFMIASQLGATSGGVYNGITAARHCGTYMEVGTDGTRYVGWRLPTEAEIKIIIKYQTQGNAAFNVTIARVLAGRNYWALDGNNYVAYTSGTNSTFVRCVRDLTLDEIDKLNNRN